MAVPQESRNGAMMDASRMAGTRGAGGAQASPQTQLAGQLSSDPQDPQLDAAFALSGAFGQYSDRTTSGSLEDAVAVALDQINCDPNACPYVDRTEARLILHDIWQSTAPHLPYDAFLPQQLSSKLFARFLHRRHGALSYLDLLCTMPQATQTLDKFLLEVGNILKTKDGDRLQDYLVFEPRGGTYPPIYTQMISEIRESFPKGTEDALEEKCNRALPGLLELEDGSSWSAFIRFIAQYFVFLRDLDVQNLATKQLEAYNLLSELVQ